MSGVKCHESEGDSLHGSSSSSSSSQMSQQSRLTQPPRHHHHHHHRLSLCWAVHITPWMNDDDSADAHHTTHRDHNQVNTACKCQRLIALPPSTPPTRVCSLSSAAQAHWDRLLASVRGEEEQARIRRFVFVEDRKRATIGRIMMQAAVEAITGAPASSQVFSRSHYQKPFLSQPQRAARQLAFNLSHHGEFVVLTVEAWYHGIEKESKRGDGNMEASSKDNNTSINDGSSSSSSFTVHAPPPLPLVGCDVATCSLPRGSNSAEELFDCMKGCFTSHEWSIIRDVEMDREGHTHADCSCQCDSCPCRSQPSAAAAALSTSSLQLTRFAWLWSLKESLIKAIGMGLSFQLQDIEFDYIDPSQRSLCSPMQVRLLGSPQFTAPDAASTSTSSSSSDTDRLRHTPLPPDLHDVSELKEVKWTFRSALLEDGEHLVSVCIGERCGGTNVVEEKVPATEVASSGELQSNGDAAGPSPSASVFSVSHPLQLAHLGRCISLPPPAPARDASSSTSQNSHMKQHDDHRLLRVQLLDPSQLMHE